MRRRVAARCHFWSGAKNGAHLGLMACESPHIIKGRIVKEPVSNTEVTKTDSRGSALVTEITETQTNKMVFNILTVSGFKSLI